MNHKLFLFDKTLSENNTRLIGTDEAGRGCGAGPVVAAAVYFPVIDNELIEKLYKLNDSKKIPEKKREPLFEIIVKNSVYKIEFGSVEEINKTNILKTSLNCMKRACEYVYTQINKENVLTIADGDKTIPDYKHPQKSIVKGDAKSACIAAASILAKVSRDKYMYDLHNEHPEYLWSKNKGYLTKEHLEAVDKYGLTKYHRKKFFEKHFSRQLSLF